MEPPLKLVLLAALALAGPVGAAEQAAPSQRSVALAPVALPVILDGRLVNYVFLDARLQLRPGADVDRVRAREPYFRDLLVRTAHSRPFSRPGDPLHLDEGAIRAVLLQAAPRLVGPGQVVGVEIVRQTPQRRTGLQRSDPRPRAIIPEVAAGLARQEAWRCTPSRFRSVSLKSPTTGPMTGADAS